MKGSRTAALAVAGALVAAWSGFTGGTSQAASTTGLRVSRATLTLDGVPFAPRGFSMIGILAGPDCTNPDTEAAAVHLSAGQLAALAAAWHANTVRFQVSQSALASTDPAAVTQYLATVAQGVAYARTAHLVVILSMQDGPLSCGLDHDLPSAATQRAWDVLAPVYSGSVDVMYELFNEPKDGTAQPPTTGVPLAAASWAEWLSGGSTPDPNQDGALGHQQLLAHLRHLGVRNVVIVDGLNSAGILPGPNQSAPLLHDTMSPPNVVYAVHPYYDVAGLADWEFRFGALSTTVPVLATEWNYKVSDCGTAKQTVAPGFLSYLADRGIGVLGMGGDEGVGTALLADWTGTPTLCGAGPDGPGAAFSAFLTRLPRSPSLTVRATTPVTVGGTVLASGSLLVDGSAPSVGLVLAVSRKDGTVTTRLPSLVTGPGGAFSFAAGTASVAGKLKLTVKYAGNAMTKAASATVTVVVTP